MKSSLSIWHLLHDVKSTVKISSIFVVFLEDMWTLSYVDSKVGTFWEVHKNVRYLLHAFDIYLLSKR